MKTVKDVLTLSKEYLAEKGVPSSRRQAEEVVSGALNIPRLDLYLQFDRPLNSEEIDTCRTFLKRRALREPIQYIRGEVEFFGCQIKVSPKVLIPRQETEILVDRIARSLEGKNLEGMTLWDVCCGSGCIGISLKKRFPTLNVVLSDLSNSALTIAKENAIQNGVDVTFLEGDLLSPYKGMKADFVVCNPPYVSVEAYTTLDPEVMEHEPKLALVAEEGGTAIYKRMANELFSYLNPHAQVWFEIGYDQAEVVLLLFAEWSCKRKEVTKDWSGNQRFFFLER